MFFPIMIVTCWFDHIHATSPTATQQVLEERLEIWWAELYREWGWERRETLERGIFPNLDGTPKRDSPQLNSNRPRSMLEAPAPVPFTSSPHQPESSASSAASQSVVTPDPGFNRYPVLPPLRPRDRSDGPLRRSPSPRRGHRLESVGSASSHGDREGRERERDERRDLPPINFYRSSRDFDAEQRSREGSREPRPLAPPNKRWPGPGQGGPLLGIEALVSAAEEHRRESLEQPSAVA